MDEEGVATSGGAARSRDVSPCGSVSVHFNNDEEFTKTTTDDEPVDNSTPVQMEPMPDLQEMMQMYQMDENGLARLCKHKILPSRIKLTSSAGPLAKMKKEKATPEISMPGFSTIFGDSSLSRRIAWAVVVTVVLSIATIQVSRRRLLFSCFGFCLADNNQQRRLGRHF